jgi:hypothetical protein
MLVGEIKSQIQSIWNDFWAGGLSNPLAVMEQITYLLFIKRLDELQTLEESKATALNIPIERRIFPEGKDGRGPDGGRRYEDLRWSRFKQFDAKDSHGDARHVASWRFIALLFGNLYGTLWLNSTFGLISTNTVARLSRLGFSISTGRLRPRWRSLCPDFSAETCRM